MRPTPVASLRTTLFFADEIIGAAKAVVGIAVGLVSFSVDPIGTAIGWGNSCHAGFAQYGGNGPSFEGFLQCVDNLNPIAEIRRQFSSSLSATNVEDSGQAFGQGLIGVGLTAAPFAKGILPPSAKCGTNSRFGNLTHSSSGIAPYNTQRMLTAGSGGRIQAHHLIEKRFALVMGQAVGDMPSIVVTQAEHQVFTNVWRAEIPYGSRNVTQSQVNGAARRIYADYPEILQALGLR